jgi:hypothetical protein
MRFYKNLRPCISKEGNKVALEQEDRRKEVRKEVNFGFTQDIVYYATSFINDTLDMSFMLGTSEASV